MAVKHLFLALLTQKELHGYELKNGFEDLASGKWPLNFGQVYQTLSRLERDGLIESYEVIQTDKPDKKVYRVTEAGRKHLEDWLYAEDNWNLFFDELALKIMAFDLINSREALEILRGYRSFILRVIKSLTEMLGRMNPTGSAGSTHSTRVMLVERNLHRAEADLKWVTSMIERWQKYD
ncbi:MAG: PadR family transcriptional regulator [Firmicutes bacterium]|nr:PadR family transcriptional regulator [Bacillota bacterium]NLL88300.1 PadR family transcriptional regulator [Bacillota bacterium]HKM18372.1 PadR family transcriptional regulator [Limnochordia bacterium]